jgi:beta-1,4-mannosyltransferase
MDRKKLRVYAWPRTVPSNKYLDLLYDAMSNLGVVVCPLRWRPLSIFAAAFNRSRTKWLHFHWVGCSRRSLVVTITYWVLILVGMLVLRCGRLKLAWTLHNITPHDSKWRIIDMLAYRLILSMTEVVFTHSNWAATQLRERYKWHGEVIVIPHGNYVGAYPRRKNPNAIRNRYSTPLNSKVFLFFGSLSPYKGIDKLIDAFKEIEDERIRLWIIGSGGQSIQRELRNRIQGHPRIIFDARFVPDDEVGDIIAAADVVVLPYNNISTSGSLVLAHSLGKPVVAPRMASIPEYTDSNASVLYEPDDPNGLKSALVQCIGADTCKMGAYARSIANAWEWSNIAQRVVERFAGDAY